MLKLTSDYPPRRYFETNFNVPGDMLKLVRANFNVPGVY